MSFSIKRPLRSNGMHWSELSKKEDEEIERVVESLHLQMDALSGAIKSSEDIFVEEFEKISSGEDSCDTKHNRVWYNKFDGWSILIFEKMRKKYWRETVIEDKNRKVRRKWNKKGKRYKRKRAAFTESANPTIMHRKMKYLVRYIICACRKRIYIILKKGLRDGYHSR